MKSSIYKLIVLFTIVALVFGVLPADRAEAAKKSKTSITVSTQEELVKALKSGKYKKITIKTDAKVSFTLAAKYSSSDLKIVINAKNATFNSKGTVGSIVVNEAKTVKEYASGNYITVNDEKLTFKAMGGASVEKLKIASETGEVRVVNNGDISRVDVTGKSKVDVEQNGNVGRLYVAAAAEIGVTGTSEEKLAVTVKSEAAGAAVKSELPVKVNAYADVDLQLEKGAENSAVTLKNEVAGVKLENNTDKNVTVADSNGVEQTVKKGEDLISDNYVGKPEETDDGTEGEISGTPSDETRGDKKEDETTTPDPGPVNEGTTTPDTETKPVVDEPKETTAGLKEKLSTAGQKAGQSTGGNAEPELVKLTSDLDLEDSITIPTGVTLLIGDSNKIAELDARSNHRIILSKDSQIIVSDGSKLRVDAKNVMFPYEKSDKYVEAMIGIKAGAKFEYGNYVFTAKADRGYNDPDEPLCSFIWWCDKDKRWDESENKDIKFFTKAVSVQNNGGTVTVSSQGLGFDGICGVFDVDKRFSDIRGTGRYDYVVARNDCFEDTVFSFVDFTHRDNIICERFVTNCEKDGVSTNVYSYQNSEVDWLNAYLDPKRAEEITAAINAGRTRKVKIDESKYASNRTVEILNADGKTSIPITGELCIPAGSTLVTNLPLDMSEYGSLKIMGTFESNAQDSGSSGLGVRLSDSVKDDATHLLAEMCGPDARLIMGNNKDEYYFKFFSDGELNEESIREKIDPEQQMLVIERTTEKIDGFPYKSVIWRYSYTGKDTEEGTPRLKVYRKTKEQNDSDGVEVVEHPFNDGLISLNDLQNGEKIVTITTIHQLVRFLEWSNSGAIVGVNSRFMTDTGENLSLSARQPKDGNTIPWELGGVTLEVNNSTATGLDSGWDSLTIRNDAILKVNKGGMLAVESVEPIASNATAGQNKALALEYAQPRGSGNGGRVYVCSGGALMIRGIRISAPGDPAEGSGDDQVVISLTAEEPDQGPGKLILQVPSNAVYTRVGGDTEESLTIEQVRESFNDFAIDIVEKGPTSASSGG